MKRLGLLTLVAAGFAAAHPMGSLSVSRYAKLEPGAQGVEVTYILELAEMPSLKLKQAGRDPAEQARAFAGNLSFRETGPRGVTQLTPRILSVEASFREGTGNLPTFRMTARLHVPASGGRFEYEDRNLPGQPGWGEVVIVPSRNSDVSKASNGDTDRSHELTVWPLDPGHAPHQTRAWFEWRPLATSVAQTRKPEIEPIPEAKPATEQAPAVEAPAPAKRTDAITNLLRSKDISFPVMLTLLGLAFWFGALHALEPGHGKTMVAAYLVGEKGTPLHALILGGMVTFTHTFMVFVLGGVTLFLSRYIMPDLISKALGIVSGLTIVWIGATMLRKRALKLRKQLEHAHAHHHHHPHTHTHGGHTHTHTHDGHTHTHVPEGEISVRSLIALGASGGLVPCPAALILLLSAISIGRIGLGLVLLVSFSLGLAIVLTATGLAVLYAKNLLPESKRSDNGFFRYMPVVSAAAIVLIGVLMTGVSLGWIPASRFIG